MVPEVIVGWRATVAVVVQEFLCRTASGRFRARPSQKMFCGLRSAAFVAVPPSWLTMFFGCTHDLHVIVLVLWLRIPNGSPDCDRRKAPIVELDWGGNCCSHMKGHNK